MNEIIPRKGMGDANVALALPQDLQAEQAVLAALLFNNELYEQIETTISPEHFIEPLHRRIFEKIRDLIGKGRLASVITLKSVMGEDAALKDVGGQEYLARLAGAALEVVRPRDYAQLVQELYMRRELIGVGDRMRERAFDQGNDLSPREQIENAEGELFELAERGQSDRGFEVFRSIAHKAIDLANKAHKREASVAGLATGFTDLDAKLGGLYPSDLIILAGRPGMGKTAFATNIAFNIARARAETMRKQQDPSLGDQFLDGGIVGFYSLEMSDEQLALRVFSEQTEIRSERIRKGQITDDEFRRLAAIAKELEDIPLYIDSTGAIPISTLATRARRLKRRVGLDLIVIDYLQLMTTSGRKKHDNRVQEVTEITQSLKALAKDLDVPILALSQLSRAVEQRPDKRPMLSDLRESGSIEQDADIVMFVHRDEYYHEQKRPSSDSAEFEKWMHEGEEHHNKATILVEKHRHGPTGNVELMFNREFTRFHNLERRPTDVR